MNTVWGEEVPIALATTIPILSGTLKPTKPDNVLRTPQWWSSCSYSGCDKMANECSVLTHNCSAIPLAPHLVFSPIYNYFRDG